MLSQYKANLWGYFLLNKSFMLWQVPIVINFYNFGLLFTRELDMEIHPTDFQYPIKRSLKH